MNMKYIYIYFYNHNHHHHHHLIWSAAFMFMGLLKNHSIYICTGWFISPSGISDLCGTVAGMVTAKGSMSTEGQTLQVSVLPYRCSICPLLVSVLVVEQTSSEVPEGLLNYPVYINTHKYLYIYFLMFILCFIPYFVQLYRVLLFISFHSMCCFCYRPFGCWLKTLINKNWTELNFQCTVLFLYLVLHCAHYLTIKRELKNNNYYYY